MTPAQLFLGQKYEEQSVPSTVSREDLEAVVGVMERDRQRASTRKLSVRKPSLGPGGPSLGPGGFPGGPAGEPAYDTRGFLSFGEQMTSSSSSCFLPSGETSQSSVSAGEDLLVRSWGDLDKDLSLIRMWYRLDENRLPAVYRLLPIRSDPRGGGSQGDCCSVHFTVTVLSRDIPSLGYALL